MSVIDSGVVQLIFDNSQFEGNVKNSISSLKDLKNNMDMTDSAKSLKALDTGVKSFKFTAMSNGVQEVRKQFNALETVASTAMARITNSVMTAGKNLVSSFTTKPIVDGFNEMQMQIGSIQTILANTQSKGTTLDQVNSALDELNTYADKTIYNFTEMTQNIGRFTAAGVDLKKSVSSIKGIANLAALSGSTPDQASRAMYQLSQAIAAGKVNLMDWNSVVNAGMGGETFQKALTRTAAAMKGFGDNIDGFKKKYWGGAQSFRESISGKNNSGWLTTDVLTETFKQFANEESDAELKSKGFTDKQIKEIQQLGKTAEESATKVRTFKQMFDALSEAAGSGWTHTWQGVIGNFQESSDLLSNINDVLSKTIQSSANARNAVVDRWRALGGRDALIGAGSNIWKSLSAVGNRLSKARQEVFPNLNGDYFNHLSHQLQNFTAKMKPSEATLDKLSNTFKGFFSVLDIGLQPIKAVGKGAVDLVKYFAPMGGKVLDLTSDFGKFFTGLDQNLKKSQFFDKVVQTGVKGIEKGFETVKGFFKGFGSNFDKSSFSWLTNGVKNIGSTLSKAFSNIKIPKNFSSFVDSLQKLVKSIGSGLGKGLSNIGKSLGNIGNIGKGFGKAMSNVGKFFDNIFTHADGSKIGDRLYKGFENFGKGLGNMFHAVSDGVNGFDTGKMSDILAQFSIIGTSLLTGRAINTFTSFGASLKKSSKDVMESAKGGFGIKDFLGNISDATKKFGNKDTDKLKAISVAVGVLAGSLVALGMIKPERMSQAIGGISAIFLELTGAMKMIDKLAPDQKGSSKLVKLTLFFNGLAIAVSILAGAMKRLGETKNIDGAITGLTAIFMNLLVFEGVLDEFAKKSKNGSAIQKGMGQLLILSGAIAILANVVKELGQMDDTQLEGGLLGLAGITGIVAAFEGILKIIEMISSLGGLDTGAVQKGMGQLVILSVAIKILASVVKELGALDMPTLGKGLFGTGSLAGILAGFEAIMACISKINDIKAGDIAGAVLTMGTMALAVKSLSKVVQALSQLSVPELAKGTIGTAAIAGIVAGFEAILGAINKIDTKGRNIAGSVATILTLTVAIKAISKVVQALSEMSTGDLAKGVAGTAGIGAILAFCTGFITELNTLDTKGKNIVGSIATLLALTAAIKGISKVVQDLGGMRMPDLGKGLLGLAGGLTAMMSALEAFKSISTDMKGLDVLKGIGSLTAISGSLIVLTGIFKAFNGIEWGSIAKGLSAIGGAIAVLGVSAKLLTPVLPAMEKLSSVLLKVGVGVGVAAAGIGIAVDSITLALSNFMGVMSSLSLVVMTKAMWANLKANIDGFFKMLEAGIGDFFDAIANTAPKIGNAIASLFKSSIGSSLKVVPELIVEVMPSVMKALDVLDKYAEPLGQKLVSVIAKAIRGAAKSSPELVLAVGDLVKSLTGSISEEFGKINTEDLLNASKVFGVVGGLGVLFSKKFGQIDLGAAAMNMGKIGVLVTEMTGIIAGLGLINSIPGVEWLLGKGGDLVGKLGEVIGKFVGGIAGGFSGQYAESSLPDIAKGLKGFSENIEGVDFESIKKAATAMTAIADISKAIPRVGGVLQLLIGGKYLDLFGGDLQKLGPGIRTFADSVEGIDDGTVTKIKNVSKAMEAVGELSKSIPRRHGLAQVFAGAKDLGMFGDDLKPFAEGLQALNNIDIDVSNIQKVSEAAKAIEPLSDAMKSIERTGGLVGRILHGWDPEHLNGFDNLGPLSTFLNEGLFGSNGLSIEDFGSDIDALKKVCAKMTDFPEVDASNIKASVESLKSIGEVMDEVMDPTGGIIGRIMHGWDNEHANMDNFDLVSTFINEGLFGNMAESVKAFGDQIEQFKILSNKLDGFDVDTDSLDKINKVIPVIKKLSSTMKEIQAEQGPTGGAVGLGKWLLFGSGDELSKIAAQLNEFSMQIQDVDTDKVATAVNAVKKIRDLVSGTKEGTAKADNFDTFADVNFSNIGNNLKQFSDSVQDIDLDAVGKATTAVQRISSIAGILAQNQGGVEAFNTFAEVKFGGLGKQLQEFATDASSIDPDTMTKVSGILEALNHTATSMTGLDQLNQLADLHIGNFGEELMTFAGAGASIEPANVENATKALSSLSKAAGEITNIDTINALSNINFDQLGSQLQSFAADAVGIKDVNLDNFNTILSSLNSMAGDMVNENVEKIIQLSNINFEGLGSQLNQFGSFVTGLKDVNMDNVTNILSSLNDTAATMGNMERITELGNVNFASLGQGLNTFASDMVGITTTNIDGVVDMLNDLDDAAGKMENIGKLNQLSSLNLDMIGSQMEMLSQGASKVNASQVNILCGALESLDMAAGSITNMDKLQSLNSLNFTNLATGLKSLSDGTVDASNIQSICTALEKLNTAGGKLDSGVANKVKKFVDGFKPLKDLKIDKDLNKSISNAFKNIKIPSDTGSKVAKQFSNSIKKANVKAAGEALGKNAAAGLSRAGQDWQSKGLELAGKFASGVSKGGQAAQTAAENMASSVKGALEHVGDGAHGWGYDIGSNLAAGINDSVSLVQAAAANLAAAAAAPVHCSEPKIGPLRHLGISGMHIAQNLAGGIKKGAHFAAEASMSLAQGVADYIHHSTPKKGPLKDDNKWGLELTQNFADGLKQGIPNVQTASLTMAQTIAGTMKIASDGALSSVKNSTLKGVDDVIKILNDGTDRVKKSSVSIDKIVNDTWAKTHKTTKTSKKSKKSSNTDTSSASSSSDTDPNEQFVSDLSSEIEKAKERNQLSLADEIKGYKLAMSKVKASANATKDAQKNANEAVYNAAEQYIEKRQKQFGDYSTDESIFWRAIMETVDKGTESYTKSVDKMNEAIISDTEHLLTVRKRQVGEYETQAAIIWEISKQSAKKLGASDKTMQDITDKQSDALITDGENMISLRKKYLGEYESNATEVWRNQMDLGKKLNVNQEAQERAMLNYSAAFISDTEDAINKQKSIMGDAVTNTADYWDKCVEDLKKAAAKGEATQADLNTAIANHSQALITDTKQEIENHQNVVGDAMVHTIDYWDKTIKKMQEEVKTGKVLLKDLQEAEKEAAEAAYAEEKSKQSREKTEKGDNREIDPTRNLAQFINLGGKSKEAWDALDQANTDLTDLLNQRINNAKKQYGEFWNGQADLIRDFEKEWNFDTDKRIYDSTKDKVKELEEAGFISDGEAKIKNLEEEFGDTLIIGEKVWKDAEEVAKQRGYSQETIEKIINNRQQRQLTDIKNEKTLLDEWTDTGKLTGKELYDYYTNVLKTMKEGTKEYLEVQKLQKDARKQMQEEILSDAKTFNTRYKETVDDTPTGSAAISYQALQDYLEAGGNDPDKIYNQQREIDNNIISDAENTVKDMIETYGEAWPGVYQAWDTAAKNADIYGGSDVVKKKIKDERESSLKNFYTWTENLLDEQETYKDKYFDGATDMFVEARKLAIKNGLKDKTELKKYDKKIDEVLTKDAQNRIEKLKHIYGDDAPAYSVWLKQIAKAQTDEVKASDEEIRSLQEEAGKAFKTNVDNLLGYYTTWNDITTKNYNQNEKVLTMKLWGAVAAATKQGTEENLQAQQAYFKASQDLVSEYYSNVKSKADSLISGFNMTSDTDFSEAPDASDIMLRFKNYDAALSMQQEYLDKLRTTGNFSEDLMEKFEELSTTDFRILGAIANMSDKDQKQIQEYWDGIVSHSLGIAKQSNQKLLDGLDPAFKMMGEKVKATMTDLTGVVSGVITSDDTVNEFVDALNKLTDTSLNDIRVISKVAEFEVLGGNISEGLAKGIADGDVIVSDAIAAVVNNAIATAKIAADSHSPSKKTMKLGEFMGEGLVIGLKNWLSQVGVAGGDLASQGLGGLSSKIADIVDAMGQDMDMSPTITPVLDLSNVEDGFAAYSNMVTAAKAQEIGARMRASYIANADAQNRVNNQPISNTSIGRINITINSTANQDANDIANSVLNKINNQIIRKGKVFSA